MAVRWARLVLLVAGGRGPAAAAAVGLPTLPADHLDHWTAALAGRNSLELKHTSSGLGHSPPSEVVLLDVERVQEMERVLNVVDAKLNPIELAFLHLRSSWASEPEHSPPGEVEPDTFAQLAEQGHDTGTEILLAHLNHAATRGLPRLLDEEQGGGTDPAAHRGRVLDEHADSEDHALRKWPVVFITGAQLAWWALSIPTPSTLPRPPSPPPYGPPLHAHTSTSTSTSPPHPHPHPPTSTHPTLPSPAPPPL